MSTNSPNVDTSPQWHPDEPFNDLPLLPPKVDLETHKVLKQCLRARVALAELKRAAQLIPNQGMLINTLPLLEAQASSEIENVVTTADELFRALPDGPDSDPAVREALRYREALLEGYRVLSTRPLGTVLAEAVVSRIKGVQLSVRKQGGTALRSSATGATIYTPPQGEAHLRDLLANWELFLHDITQIDPLVRMAVGHYQFEAIHPFPDGNGRTGRILNSLFLIEADLLTMPILYLSRYFIANKTAYYERLLDVTATGAWERWILFVLEGVETTAVWTLTKIEAIRKLYLHTAEYLRIAVPKVYSRELVDVIFEQPYARINDAVARGVARRQTASKYLHGLADAGVLNIQQSGREVLFVHTKLLRLLTQEEHGFKPYETE